MINPIEIGKAWAARMNPTEVQQELAEERRLTCNDCPSKRHNGILNFDYCGECNCPIAGKIFSDQNNCPKQNWKR